MVYSSLHLFLWYNSETLDVLHNKARAYHKTICFLTLTSLDLKKKLHCLNIF
jgi:hypothetical protein